MSNYFNPEHHWGVINLITCPTRGGKLKSKQYGKQY
jgi:hypothetical protein